MGIYASNAAAIYKTANCSAKDVVTLQKDKVKLNQLTLGQTLSISRTESIKECVGVIGDIETATTVLGAKKKPNMNMSDVMVAGVLALKP